MVQFVYKLFDLYDAIRFVFIFNIDCKDDPIDILYHFLSVDGDLSG